MFKCSFAYPLWWLHTFGGYMYSRKKAIHCWEPLVKTGLYKLRPVCYIIRQFTIIMITEAVFWKEKIAISVKLHLQGGYNFCVAVTDNVNHGLLPFFKGSMHFPLFIIAPIGPTPVYSHGLRYIFRHTDVYIVLYLYTYITCTCIMLVIYSKENK